MAMQYASSRSGPLSMAPSQFRMFTKSDPSKETPDIEYHVLPLSTDEVGDPSHRFPAITVSACNLRPDNVGSMHLASRDMSEQPEIRLNYLSAERDRPVAIASIRQARGIMTAQALKKYHPEEMLPGPAIESDEDLLSKCRHSSTSLWLGLSRCLTTRSFAPGGYDRRQPRSR